MTVPLGQLVQCSKCHMIYNVESDTWSNFGEHIEVALHVLCQPCLRAYVKDMEKSLNEHGGS